MSGPPDWLLAARERWLAEHPEQFDRFPVPEDTRRQAAVLMLIGRDGAGGAAVRADGAGDGDGGEGGGSGPDLTGLEVVLTERSTDLRSHAGQVSFPGGGIDPGEDAVAAALREAEEEVGLDPAGVDVVGTMPALYMTPSRTGVTPVIGWWREPGPLRVVDPAEVAQVARIPVGELVDPASRFTVRGPAGYRGPAFDVGGLFVWGFTAALLSDLLEACGLARPWDAAVERRLPVRFVRQYVMSRARRGAS